jgi:hypothetical protein
MPDENEEQKAIQFNATRDRRGDNTSAEQSEAKLEHSVDGVGEVLEHVEGKGVSKNSISLGILAPDKGEAAFERQGMSAFRVKRFQTEYLREQNPQEGDQAAHNQNILDTLNRVGAVEQTWAIQTRNERKFSTGMQWSNLLYK